MPLPSLAAPSPLSVTLPQAAEAIRRAHHIVMACHVSPDGDALGSMLGLALALAPLGKNLILLSQDGVPAIYQFLPQKQLVQSVTECAHFDLALVLDCGDLARVGDRVLPLIARAETVVDIDHHAVAGAFGDIQVLDTQSASTSEIVYALLQAMHLPLTPQIATCLFTGVTTDTGSFRYQNVSPQTLRIAAQLVEAGARPALISEHVFENKTFAATRLLGHALSSLSATADRRMRTAKASLARCGACAERMWASCFARCPRRRASRPFAFRCARAPALMLPSLRSSSAAAGTRWRRAARFLCRWPKPSASS